MNPVSTNRETTFDLLSSAVRRELVTVLHESGPVARSRLTERLAAAEADGDADEELRRRTRISLHHNHLPRLADAGLVNYDDDEVTPTSRLEAVARKIARFERTERALTQA